LPHAVFARLDGGHNILMERPKEVISEIMKFLKVSKLI
jgi:hypothetical protein